MRPCRISFLYYKIKLKRNAPAGARTRVTSCLMRLAGVEPAQRPWEGRVIAVRPKPL